MSLEAVRRNLLRSFAALASAVPLFRPGNSLPGSAAPLMGAPAASTATPGVSKAGTARQALRRSLGASVSEGIVAEVFTACAGATVLTGWALALKLGPFLVGVMTALPFFAQFIQFPAAWLTSTFGYRRVAMVAVCLSRQVMLPLCVLPWLPLSLVGQQRLLVSVAAVSAVLGVIGNNAWVAWMGELVPESFRGRFFGRRSALCTLGGTVASLVAGVLMDKLRPPEGVGLGLPLLAALACVAGVVTTVLMARQHDPAPRKEKAKLDFHVALLPLRDERARRVLLYQVAWNAAVGVSAPFYAFHMLKNLKMGFLTMALYSAAVAGMRILAAPLWGRIIDRLGAQPVLLACSLGIGVIPSIWLFPTATFLWPLLLDVMLAGVLWGGHGLASFALPLSVAPRQGRPFYLAAFSTAGGLAYAAASALGGGLASLLPTEFTLGGHLWVNLHVLFALSAATRVAAAFLAMRIVEPGTRPVCSLGALVSLVGGQLRARSIPVPTPAPVLAEPQSVNAES